MTEPRYIDDLSERELYEIAVEQATDGFIPAIRIAREVRRRGFLVSTQGLTGALRRHPKLVYGFDYAYGVGRREWRIL